MTEGAVYYDLEYLNGSVSADYILENLTSDTPMICSMTPGDFTTSGHFIVLTGIDEERVEIFVLIEDGLQNDYKHRAKDGHSSLLSTVVCQQAEGGICLRSKSI